MALWEYKTITSGRGGFASATMLESYLNQLGKDEWEIIDFRADPTNALAFTGLARRPTQREWTLEAAVAAAAKAEADKLRAELMHKQHAGDASASADAAGATAGDKAAGPEGLRQLRDTDRDGDPEALADEASHGAEDWNNLEKFEDDLPTFFDAIKPHLRKNPSTPGQSVALNYLAKRWEQPESDVHGALRECGFVIPESDADAPVYLEFEGDLYWVEKNNRAQFFLNTREKPQPKFRIVQGKPLDPADPVFQALAEEHAAAEAERAKRLAEQAAREAEAQARRAEREAQRLAAEQARREQQAAAQAARDAARAAAVATTAPSTEAPAPVGEAAAVGGFSEAEATPVAAPVGGGLPVGEALLDAIRPQMRRNRRGPGYSGSSAYLAKHFKVEEAALRAALAALGLSPADNPSAKVEARVIGAYAYWVNKDNNGGLWINGREATPREQAEAGGAIAPVSASGDAAAVPAEPAVPAERAPEPSRDDAGSPPIFRAVPRAMPPIPAAREPEPAAESAPEAASVSEPTTGAPASVTGGETSRLAALRLLMKPNKSRSGLSGSLAFLAEALGRGEAELLSALVGQGLVEPVAAPEGETEAKPVFVEHGGEIFWLSRYAKDGSLWLNAKAARSAARKPKAKDDGAAEAPAADGASDKPAKPARPRTRRKE